MFDEVLLFDILPNLSREFSVYDSPDEEIRAKASERRSSSSNFNSGPSSRPSLKIHSSSEASEDPLLPFYAKAREEAELMVCCSIP